MENTSVIKTALKISASMLIGRIILVLIFHDYVAENSIMENLVLLFIFAGIPLGWSFISRHFGTLIPLNVYTFCIVVIVKSVLSMLIGWLVMVYLLITLVIGIVKEVRGGTSGREAGEI